MIGKITFTKEAQKHKYMVFKDYLYDYNFVVRYDKNDDLKNLLTRYDDLKEFCYESMEYLNYNDPEIRELMKLQSIIKQDPIGYLQKANCIVFEFPLEEIPNLIKENPFLKNKQVVVCETQPFTVAKLQEFSNTLNNDLSYIEFKFNDNRYTVNYDIAIKTANKIENIVNHIKKLNFSPIETIMYVYDLVREKTYNDSSDENPEESRDISKILFNDKIVCEGYSRLINVILNRLGIKCEVFYMFDKKGERGHARNEIYVQDKKYGIDNVFYFDSTWDSYKPNEENHYLTRYPHFAISIFDMKNKDKNEYIYENLKYINKKFPLTVENMIRVLGISNLPYEIIDDINYMSKVINGYNLLIPNDSSKFDKVQTCNLINSINELFCRFDSLLDFETYCKILFNVRKIEYYEDPEKFPFSKAAFVNTAKNSNWKYDSEINTLLNSLDSIGLDENEDIVSEEKQPENTEEKIETMEIPKKIEQIKLAKILSNLYKKREGEELDQQRNLK